MTVTSARIAAVLIPLTLAVAGCDELQGTTSRPDGFSEASASLGPSEPRTEVRDVERPDIFSTTDAGLWDGRPSLGGIWIAHPDVKDPERATITNKNNGKTIAGALFRRERANPGPRIQVSSDAAVALGMLAGQPAELSIVAVRQEEFTIEPEPLPLSDEEAVGTEETAEAPEDDSGSEVAEAGVIAAAGIAAAEATEKPKRKGFWESLKEGFSKKPASDVATEADTALIEGAAVPEVETAPLDPVTTAAAAAIAKAETSPEPAPRPAATEVRNPYVQVGLFSIEENAGAAAASLRQAGIVPTVSAQEVNGKTMWRVFVGPVSSADDQAEILAQIKRLGYKDAFLAPN